MPVDSVHLRLVGPGPHERVEAWVQALGRVAATRRGLAIDDAASHPDLPQWCDAAGVDLGQEHDDATMVVASAADLPTPGALHRLVAAVADSGRPLQTRVLPYGATTDEAAPVVCVSGPAPVPAVMRTAVSAAQVVAALATDVRRLESAAVFVDRRSDVAARPAHREAGHQPPYGHPAALPSTSLHLLLAQAGLAVPELPEGLEERPFLTVLTRTQGTRLLCLEETLTCLAGQSSRDFEVVLACHRVTPDALSAVEAVVAASPAWLRERVRVLEVERPGRSAPLNDALEVARGRYAAMLDDDDAVTADWVAAFASAEAEAPGTVLRCVALAQDVRPVEVVDRDGDRGPAPVDIGPAHRVWSDRFNLADHLWDNASPPMTFAVPRGVFGDLGRRFDESLDTTEDWDFLLRAAILTGVTSTPAVTAAYRVWTGDEGSRHLHDEEHWGRGRAALLRGIDEQVVLLPPGAAREVRDLHQALEEERAEKYRFAGLNEQAAADLVTVNEAVVALRARVAELEERLARQRRRLRKNEDRPLD